MNAKHTATPWYIEQGDEGQVYGINGADNQTIIETDAGFYPPTLEDAKHIVNCVNLHDEMVNALIVIAEYLAKNEKNLPETQERDEIAADLMELIDKAKGDQIWP